MSILNNFFLIGKRITDYVFANNGVTTQQIHEHLGGTDMVDVKSKHIIESVCRAVNAKENHGKWFKP